MVQSELARIVIGGELSVKEHTSPERKRRIRISKISAMHYFKLVFRSLILLAAVIDYIFARLGGENMGRMAQRSPVKGFIWIVFAIEMALRFFPSKLESMGCQKVFAHNYIPRNNPGKRPNDARSTLLVALAWLLLNGAIGVVYKIGWIDKGILVLISLVYSVCDMICILFFCPFQEWFMKNKCCGTCRIYNWDFAMMFTPLIFVGGFWSWSLVALSLGLLVKWEIRYRMHPEWFYEEYNHSLGCAHCREKLCRHKKSLQSFLRKMGRRFGS